MAAVEAARLDELREGVPKRVKAGGREIVLVKWREDVFALRNICPHQSASFEAGYAHPRVQAAIPQARKNAATAFEMTSDDANAVLQCPWHGWEFRLTDGYCWSDPRFRVRAYPAYVDDGTVFVDVDAKVAAAREAAGRT